MSKTRKRKTGASSHPQNTVNDPLAADGQWEKMFGQLLDFHRDHKHFHVPQQGAALRTWLAEQRLQAKKGTLPAAQRERLEFVGCPLKATDIAWEEQFASLVEFHARHGHTWVPENFADDPGLARWVMAQRQSYRKVSPRARHRLRQLQFNKRELKPQVIIKPKWEACYRQFADLCRLHGSPRIPGLRKNHRHLESWLDTQKAHRNKGTLHPLKMEKLARLGVWNNLGRTPSAVQTANPKEPGNAAAIANWNERCAQLAKLIRQHGTWHIACRNKQTKALYYWACDQSKRLLRGTMPHEQALQLRAIGFWGLPAASKLQRKTRPKKKRTTRVQLSPLRQQPRDKQQVTTIQCSEPGPAPA